MRLLLVEDDLHLGDAIKIGLTHQGFVVDWVTNGDMARRVIKDESFDLVLLDLGLPKLSGLDCLRFIREKGYVLPVLILTARDSVEDRILGLDSGADDYLPKPFDLFELGARVRALVRRAQGRAKALIHYRNLVLDPAAHELRIDGELIPLSRREFALLEIFLENVGHVFSREKLTQKIYGWDEDLDSNALEVHIYNLRKKLNANYIRTIRGVGYIMEKET